MTDLTNELAMWHFSVWTVMYRVAYYCVYSGSPNSPTELLYELLESSLVQLQWKRPSFTGGVSIMQYRVTANNKTAFVQNDTDVVFYTSPVLIYGQVQVRAINLCDQISEAVTVTIPTAGIL